MVCHASAGILEPQAGLAENLEELNILKNVICGLRANILQQAEVRPSTNTKETEKLINHNHTLRDISKREH